MFLASFGALAFVSPGGSQVVAGTLLCAYLPLLASSVPTIRMVDHEPPFTIALSPDYFGTETGHLC